MAVRIIYAGYDQNTLKALFQRGNQVRVAAVSEIQEFQSTPTLSPFNSLFKLLYRLRLLNSFGPRSRSAELLVRAACRAVSPLTTHLWRAYRDYLLELSARQLPVLDFEDAVSVQAFVRDHAIDVLVVSNWRRLSDAIIHAPRFGGVNVHSSRLPQYRGATPTLWALRNRDKASAVSYFRMNSEIVGGDIIAQHPFEMEKGNDSLAIQRKIDRIVARTLADDLVRYVGGRVKPVTQDEALVTGTPKFFSYMRIRWGVESAREITNKAALYPHLWPLNRCFTEVASDPGAKKISIRSLSLYLPEVASQSRPAGHIWIRGLFFYVQASPGVVRGRLFVDLGIRDSLDLLTRRVRRFEAFPGREKTKWVHARAVSSSRVRASGVSRDARSHATDRSGRSRSQQSGANGAKLL